MKRKANRKDILFIGVVTLVHIVFFLLACVCKRIYMGDSFEYIYEAVNIKKYLFFYSGNPAMPIVPEYMTQRQPLYPLFLLAVYLLSVNNWIVIALQNVISIFNVWYARKIFISIGYQKKYDWLLLLFVAAYPAQFINANTIAPDILLQTCALLYFGSFIAFVQRKQVKYSIYMSMALIAGMLVKPVLYPFAVVHMLIVIITAAIGKMKMQRPVVIAIVPLCAVFLYCSWNEGRTGKFHFTSNQAFNASYYFYSFVRETKGMDSADRFLQRERSEYNYIPDYKDRYEYANDRGMKLLRQNFVPYMLFHLKNSARMFIEPGKAEIDLFTGKLTYGTLYSKAQTGFFPTLKSKGLTGMGDYFSNNRSMLFVIVILLFNCVRLAGFAWFLCNRKIPGLTRAFVMVFVLYFAIAAGPIANTRYFLPVSLIVIGCGVMGLVQMFRKKEEGINETIVNDLPSLN